MKYNHNRIKPKYSSKNKKTITKEDKHYLEWLQHNPKPCLVCGSRNIEWHHIKKNSIDKKNHKELIPLCPMHHRLSNELSAHGTPRKFKEVYPIEQQRELAKEIYKEYSDLS